MSKATWRLASESKNYKNGKFQNLSFTPVMAENASYKNMFREYFGRPKTVTPPFVIPSVKTDFNALRPVKPVIVWFGHSSYLIHVNEINILIDPVFSGHASPFRSMVKSFAGSNVYSADDMPAIDLLIVTHDHYDHLDKQTIRLLQPKIRRYITPLGVARSIPTFNQNNVPVIEMDWWETEDVLPGITLTATPARHFSGRGLKRGGSLWASFVLNISGYNIFIGGDSGYDTHFKRIGEKYGPFDIVMLECGQYNVSWPNIHMMPEETVQAAVDLKAKVLLPVHWGKFRLAIHPWTVPVIRVSASALEKGIRLTTPMIGEPVVVDVNYPNSTWWNM